MDGLKLVYIFVNIHIHINKHKHMCSYDYSFGYGFPILLEAERWLQEMIERGLEPDLVVCHAGLHACQQSEHLPGLWRIWVLMQENMTK